jgi:hypothetical protein
LPGDQPPSEVNVGRGEATIGPLQAAGVIVSLDREASREGLSVADRVTLQDAGLREWMANRVVPAFLWANGLTLAAIGILVVLDEVNIARHLTAPGERIINSQVIMALLGATTVQVGAIAALMSTSQAPNRSVPTSITYAR